MKLSTMLEKSKAPQQLRLKQENQHPELMREADIAFITRNVVQLPSEKFTITKIDKWHDNISNYITGKNDKMPAPLLDTKGQMILPKATEEKKKITLGSMLAKSAKGINGIVEKKKIKLKIKSKRSELYGTGLTKRLAIKINKEAQSLAKRQDIKLRTGEQLLREVEKTIAEKTFPEELTTPILDLPIMDYVKDITLDQAQELALKGIRLEQFSCLIGPAGVGKTTLVQFLVAELEKSLQAIDLRRTKIEFDPDEEATYVPPIAFCAFTGMATDQMRMKLAKKYHPLCDTIHGTLGFHPVFYTDVDKRTGKVANKMRFEPAFDELRKLPYRAYLIDEAASVPIHLWNQLLAAIKPGSRIIFIGDINQIVPVQGRGVLGFAMTQWPTFQLTKIHRQAEGNPIIENAHLILKGFHPKKYPGQFDIIDQLPGGSTKASEMIRNAIKALTIKKQFNPQHDTLIVPQNKSVLGQDFLNAELMEFFNPYRENSPNPRIIIKTGMGTKMFAVGDKVMILANHRPSGLTNGMIGFITEININGSYKPDTGALNFSPSNVTLTKSDMISLEEGLGEFDPEKKQDEKEDASQRQASHITTIKFRNGVETSMSNAGQYRILTLAYAITCHKSQGSEYPTVVIAMHSANAVMLCREWLYTAVTRAQKRVILLCNERALSQALKIQRITGKTLQEKIKAFNAIQDQKDTSVPILPEPRSVEG